MQTTTPPKAFIWGANGAVLTPEEIAQQKQYEQQLAAKGIDTSPVSDWTQGAARVADAIAGAVRRGRLGRAEAENNSYNETILKSLIGSSAPSVAAQAAATSPAPAVASGDGSYRDAIASIESAGSGDYAAVGPTHPKMGRALGRYQIMESNIGPWSQEALGRAVTPEEFMANPELQDAIFDNQFGKYVQKYGPEGAAQAWLGGEGGVGKVDRKDSLGTSIGTYGQRFMNALAPENATDAIAAQMAPPREVGPTPGSSMPMVAQAEPAPAPAIPGMNEAIVRAMTDPRANSQTKAIAQILMQQQMARQQAQQEMLAKQADPAYQLGLEKTRLEVENMRNPRLTPADQLAREKFDYERGTEAPKLETLYDEKTGQEYKAKYNRETGQYERVGGAKAPSGTSLSVGPNGEVQFSQGNAKPLTEGQSKDAFFTTRMTAAAPTLNQYEDALMSLPDNAAGAIPFNLGNYAQSEEYQLARDAGRDFVTAYLRKDSGAALTPSEEKMYGEMLLPQPGDKPATIEAKRTRRAIATEAIKSGMPPAALDNVIRAIQAVPGAGQAQELIPTDIPGVKIRRKN